MAAKRRTPKTSSRTSKKLAPAKKPRARKFSGARFPILEYDPSRSAVIEPHIIHKPREIPEHCVLCFFQDVIDDVCKSARVVHRPRGEEGEHPIYELQFGDRRIVVAHPRVGAPMSAAVLESLIAIGCRKFIACGGAGVLVPKVVLGHLVVPTSAVRDEGTSYHYLPAGREVKPSPRALSAIKSVLKANGHDYLLGKTWTTDGLYRETRAKVERRKREGCLTVEMEAAAFFAVAQFRGVEFGQILYAGDDLSGEWDHRNWMQHEIRERLFHLAAEACLML
jgi:uridine phosphorylase